VWNSVDQHSRRSYTSIIHGKYSHEETIATASFADTYVIVRDLAEAQMVRQEQQQQQQVAAAGGSSRWQQQTAARGFGAAAGSGRGWEPNAAAAERCAAVIVY
jgi:4-hydroxy-3-methylbut-2-enyl diphosphate reductase IspH